MKNIVVLSPDADGVKRAKSFQEKLMMFGKIESELAIIVKSQFNNGEDTHFIGNVDQKV